MSRPIKRARSENDANTIQTTTTTTTTKNTNTNMNLSQLQIPCVSKESNPEEVSKSFDIFQALYFPRLAVGGEDTCLSSSSSSPSLGWKDLGSLYQRLNEKDKSSWCVERASASEREEELRKSNDDFLKPTETTGHVAYCSFVIQKDQNVLSDTVPKLPLKELACAPSWEYEPCLWIFFGRNDDVQGKSLRGRPEHTDSISHDGTWHYQLSGTKRWFLRPTNTLLEHLREKLKPEEYLKWKQDERNRIRIDCKKGDVLVVNTRLWHHQTVIPAQKTPSVSYARDFWVNKKKSDMEEIEVAGDDEKFGMTNVDGVYAVNDIEKGTIIFTEVDMPDCELHRSSTNPNCEVVDLDVGVSAVVSLRAITAGEFFCVPASSDEYEDDDEDDDDDGEEEAELESEDESA